MAGDGAGAQLDPRLVEHRKVWDSKEALRRIYRDYYDRMLQACPADGRILDIGGGSGLVKSIRKDVVSLDILPFYGIDVVADAHDLPFASGSLAGITMLDVLHHLARPVPFLAEAARVLRPGGRLAMIEPGITPLSWWFYRFLHQEPVVLSQDPFSMTASGNDKDPFDSNQAIPTLLFGRESELNRLSLAVPQLRVVSVDWLSLVVYPLSGGFKRWCLVPARWVGTGLAIENRLPMPLRRLCGFRLSVVLERVEN